MVRELTLSTDSTLSLNCFHVLNTLFFSLTSLAFTKGPLATFTRSFYSISNIMSPCESPSSKFGILASSTFTRHPGLSFEDGNLILLAQKRYFVVHKGLVCRHSPVIRATVEALESTSFPRLEGHLVVEVQENSEEMFYFVKALYDGIPDGL